MWYHDVMNMIRVEVRQTTEVTPGVVAKISSEFLEYLETRGWSISVDLTAEVSPEQTYEELANDYANFIINRRDGNIR